MNFLRTLCGLNQGPSVSTTYASWSERRPSRDGRCSTVPRRFRFRCARAAARRLLMRRTPDYSGVVIAFPQVRPGFADGLACRPGSVRRSVATIHLRRPLPAASSDLPAHSGGPPSNVRASRASTGLLDLAPGGVYRSGRVTSVAGGLLHHRFTLTAGRARWRFVLCGTVPRVAPGGCYPPPCPVEPGPSSGSFLHAVARPAHPR